MAAQLNVYENKLKNYNSEHKTSVFWDYDDIKSKSLCRLDSIDITNNSKREAKRNILYDQLFDLAERFKQKIHQHHSTCTECEQVKVVMINLK